MLGLRVTAAVKNRLDKAAEASGRSQSQEAEIRLEQSFTEFDGPELRRAATLWAAAFVQGAGTSNSKEFTDPTTTAYLGGAFAVMQSLTIGMPDNRKTELVEALKKRFLAFWVPVDPDTGKEVIKPKGETK